MKLRRAAQNGRLFYSITQAARLLEITEFICRYRIQMYRLDALLIGDRFRIPWTAIVSSKTDYQAICRQWQAALQLIRHKALRSEGTQELPLLTYDQMDGSEKDCQDWYDLPALGLPQADSARSWEIILGTRERQISKEMGLKARDIVAWPEMYDYLIDHEFINLSCSRDEQEPMKGVDMEVLEGPSLFEEEI